MREHFGELKRNQHHSPELQADYNSYGRDSFYVEILEECENSLCRDREQHYLDILDAVKNGYNISSNSHTNNSESSCCYKPKYGESNPFYGRHHTEKTKDILRLNGLKHIGKKHTEETKSKMSQKASKGGNANATHILQYDTKMNFIKEWDCIADIVDFYNMSGHSHVSNCCERNVLHKRNKWCTAKGFIWMYKDTPKRKKVVI